MRVATWNIRHGGGRRRRDVARAASQLDADVLIICEYRSGAPDLGGLLAGYGYQSVTSSPPDHKHNGVLIAARTEIVAGDVTGPPGDEHRWLHALVPALDLDVVGCYLPGFNRANTRKQDYWDYLLRSSAELGDRSTVIGGDLNTGLHLLDENGRTLRSTASFSELGDSGWVDAYRCLYPTERTSSWWSSYGNGFRLDHLFLSPASPRAVAEARYVTDVADHVLVRTAEAPGLSDHAALVVDLS